MPLKSAEDEKKKKSYLQVTRGKAAKILYMARQNMYHSYRETILVLQKEQLLKTGLG